jgi:hypothetical protein
MIKRDGRYASRRRGVYFLTVGNTRGFRVIGSSDRYNGAAIKATKPGALTWARQDSLFNSTSVQRHYLKTNTKFVNTRVIQVYVQYSLIKSYYPNLSRCFLEENGKP